MYHSSYIVCNASAWTATLGADLVWDAALEPHGVNVPGVCVTGFILGGDNQYGSNVDTVAEYELATPDGTILLVTKETQPNLFFGPEGGFRHFVRVLWLWGFLYSFSENCYEVDSFPNTSLDTSELSKLTRQQLATTADFAVNVTDHKANIIAIYGWAEFILEDTSLI
ncbi:hypothetical protein P691DRAFT_758757 [Macrolepiota fuliginosa MF-IS2]|uniref:Uncharacterized protein n=1 Tax=Macrolepiota fuliginosa MF-IS2 TaxID=1400762 RepID=A0A9P6C5X6_9AGAR|nr:hypothetical protein P691DRAFT_758757 [Macrolepiota fuliginosa MF-IS2]